MRDDWCRLDCDDALGLLGSSRAGLNRVDAAQRLARHGPNLLVEKPPRTALALFAAQFGDFMILTLLAAAVVAGLLGDLTDAAVIVAIVVLNAILGLVQEFRAQRALAALKAGAQPAGVGVAVACAIVILLTVELEK